MQRTQIMLEPEQHQTLSEIARRENRSLADLIREMVDEGIALYQKQRLTQAAEALLADYQNDAELTAFIALDGEDFHAQG